MRAAAATDSAIDRLEAAFARKARGVALDAGRPLVGVFGGDVPTVLIAASGASACDVGMAPEIDAALVSMEVDAVTEPFVGEAARRFLHRLFRGAFDGFATIVFSRASAPAYLAYLYATECRRQGMGAGGPALHLWNAQLTDSSPVAAFNLTEARRLEQALVSAGGAAWSAAGLGIAIEEERKRALVLRALEELRRATLVSGHEALRWRNAGRYMDAGEHARLLEAALAPAAGRTPRTGARIGLVGSPTADGWLYDLIEETGTIVADPHPYGSGWPPPVPPAATEDLGAILHASAGNALDPRSLPVAAHRRAIVDACLAARCDRVVFQVDEHDDCFGWDLPAMRDSLEAAGVVTVDLGLRPERADPDWQEQARAWLRAAGAEPDR